jgi:hypothetical protein
VLFRSNRVSGSARSFASLCQLFGSGHPSFFPTSRVHIKAVGGSVAVGTMS